MTGTSGKPWSMSRIECGLDCLRKYFLRYVAHAPETDASKALQLGSDRRARR